MTARLQLAYWIAMAILIGLLIYALRSVLLPFVAGLAVAYFLDPAVDRVERAGLSRTWSTAVITLLFFALVATIVVLVAPLVQGQVLHLVELFPTYLKRVQEILTPVIERVMAYVPAGDAQRPSDAAGLVAENAGRLVNGVLGSLWSGGLAFFNILSLMFITPIVTFYLLRDWDRILRTVDGLLPRQHAETIRTQCNLIDQAMAGFLRGQATVCLAQAAIYAVALSLLDLRFGLVIGLLAGFLAFVPYVGLLVGLVTALVFTILQHGFDVGHIAPVVGVFALVQIVDGGFLTPRLVGSRVGLHPVWIIFALLSGGVLFGFVGILLAVPIAAAVGVLVRFVLGRYRLSRLFTGPDEAPESGG
ncbi:MAG: AI-2E family transporter [Alphaproteobacteria bacterium]|nr:AI-2E family transporter [Alphaproteobacteria bacterium]